MSTADITPPAPAPNRAREPAPARGRAHGAGGPRWFRLVVFLLILVGIVATLVKLPWSRHGAPPPAGQDSPPPAA